MLAGLRYPGGKHPANPLGRWIASQIPTDTDVYAEPFAGMLGIMLQRRPAEVEFASEINPLILAWWNGVRDNPDELARQIRRLPCSRVMWERRFGCSTALDAYIYYEHGYCDHWMPTFSVRVGSTKFSNSEIVKPLHQRVQRVIFLPLCGVSFLHQSRDWERAVLYCDPPYPSNKDNWRIYAHGGKRCPDLDVDRMTDALLAHKGRIALSGVPGEWDHLGWRHSDLKVHSRGTFGVEGRKRAVRTERLWTNYSPICPSLPEIR